MGSTQQAIELYAKERLGKIARSVIYRLQRLPEMGVHPYGWDMGSFWNLFSWELQNGPTDQFLLMSDIVEELTIKAVQSLPYSEAQLLTIACSDAELDGRVRDDILIRDNVIESIHAMATMRNLERFDPDYVWHENL